MTEPARLRELGLFWLVSDDIAFAEFATPERRRACTPKPAIDAVARPVAANIWARSAEGAKRL